ncbi:MAG: hypothetical protein IJ158_06585 [Treponema sp.]|nr:hypothetical protein [Treponema sp.]
MDSKDAFQKILKSYERYYNVSVKNVDAPFAAEAVFKSHNEQYMLVKAAKIADIDSNEFVFFYISNENPEQNLTEVAQAAWARGLERITPYYGHRNTDITLILLSERFSEESFKLVKKLKFYKSYKFGLFGWSAFRALAYETSTGRAVTNRRGSDLKKLVSSL